MIQKTRVIWLVSFICVWVYNVVPLLWAFIFVPWQNRFTLLFPTGLFVLFAWALYHCTYKKPGTKLITFYLIFLGVWVFLNVFMLVSGKSAFFWSTTANEEGISRGKILFPTALSLWMFLITWKLRKINKSLKK